MLRSPALYTITPEKLEVDPLLETHRADIIHTAAIQLERSNLIKYDRKSGYFQVLLHFFYLYTEIWSITNVYVIQISIITGN